MTSLADAWPFLSGPRVEDHWVEVLDSDDNPVGPLRGLTSATVEQNVYATIRGGLTLSFREEEGQGPLDWHTARLRPWVRVNGFRWPLGVYLPAAPSLRQDEFGRFWEVPALDKTAILDQDLLPESYSVPAGTVVTTEVAALIIGAGEVRLSITPSELTTRSAMTWEPGTSRLRIINDLLDSINYFALWADRRGRFRAEPYQRPQDRPLTATFARGEAAIHSPSWSREQDIASVPNRVILLVEGDDETPGLIGVADNTNPASPYSIPARNGRIVARLYENVEASSQEVLDAMAARYLADASAPGATLDVAHAHLPLSPNDVVRFSSDGIDTLATVERFTVSLSPGALTSATWREVPHA